MPESLQGDGFETFWEESLAILRHHSQHIRTSARAMVILVAMRGRITERRTGGNATLQQSSNPDEAAVMHGQFQNGTAFANLPPNMPGAAMDDIEEFDFDGISETWMDQCLTDLGWPGLVDEGLNG